MPDDASTDSRGKVFKYDVVLSFAGEDRGYVEQVASALDGFGVRYFYDSDEQVTLWGKDLFEHLTEVYQRDAKYMVMFISAEYAKKKWTRHERRVAQARAFEAASEYILPARFDDTTIPGVLPTIGYIDISKLSPAEFAEMIVAKVHGTNVVYGDGESPGGISIDQKRAAATLLAKVQSETAPLAQCIAEALSIAQAIGDEEFENFCAYEVGGWPRDAKHVLEEANYRSVPAYACLDELNLNYLGWGKNASLLLEYLRDNPEQFPMTPLGFALPVAELERRARQPISVSSVLRTVMKLGENNPDAKNPDAPVYVYMAADAFVKLVDGIRSELTRRLLRVVRAK